MARNPYNGFPPNVRTKAGQWYLSGAIPQAYRAPNDLTQEFYILRLVKTQTVTTTRIVPVD